MPDLNLRHNKNPVCPHCGHVDHDGWELSLKDEEMTKMECDKCGKTYAIIAHIEVTYSTSIPAEAANG